MSAVVLQSHLVLNCFLNMHFFFVNISKKLCFLVMFSDTISVKTAAGHSYQPWKFIPKPWEFSNLFEKIDFVKSIGKTLEFLRSNYVNFVF